ALQFNRGQDGIAASEKASTRQQSHRSTKMRRSTSGFFGGAPPLSGYTVAAISEAYVTKNSRREFLTSSGTLAIGGGGLVGGATANAGSVGGAESTSASGRKIKVVVCGGHPGDPEYGCGGTVARLTQMGHDVALFYLNDGGWPPTSSEARVAEAKKACE